VKWQRSIVVGVILVAASVGFSFVRPWGNLRSVNPDAGILSGSGVPDDVRGILDRKCADCHSNQTHWPVYSRFAPASWLVEHDVNAGRSAMNLSQWKAMGSEDRIAVLTRIAAEIRTGEMPPKPYATIHAARLTDVEKQEISTWARSERKLIRTEISGQKEKGTIEATKRK